MLAIIALAVLAIRAGAQGAPPAAVQEDLIVAQRAVFLKVIEDVERGDWNVVWSLSQAEREQLADYVLWPDLRAAYLRATLRRGDNAGIDEFLARYGTLKPARELRYRYALDLARNREFAAYFDIYESFYQGLEIATLDCLALQAELEAGRLQRVVSRARDLWLVGKSQVDECDPVFERLKAEGVLGIVDYRKRYELAIEARNFTLARWLGKAIDDAYASEARRWLQAQSGPQAFLERFGRVRGDAGSRARLAYAVERLTYDDPIVALAQWRGIRDRQAFTAEQRIRLARHIALWTARDGLPGAAELLAALPAAAQSDEVRRWRARVSLRAEDWQTLLADIRRMSDEELESEEWRYWHAVALRKTGNEAAANSAFALLAAERSYYGFLAADAIGASYALDDHALPVDETLIASMATRRELVRARELFKVGMDGRGRSEWDAAVATLSADEKIQAAILADRWGWHSRAIATVARLGEYDDLGLRYPLPYKAEFEANAETAQIATTWAYGIARSESLFMRDVRSSAGAVGLMQLMPATGKSVARSIDLPYAGIDTLTDPAANIRLGTTYLARMADRYDGNTVLATAAYNAGPQRVDRWRPSDGQVDARVWIENIPFNETRRYVRRVKAAETIFHWRMTGDTRRLSDSLPAISPVTDSKRLARRGQIAPSDL